MKEYLKCKHYCGEIKRKTSRIIYDQLSDDLVLIPFGAKRAEDYLQTNYGITPREYYNIVMHGDINFIEKCKYCNSELKFKSIIGGYGTYCGNSCSTKDQWKDPIYRDNQIKIMSNYWCDNGQGGNIVANFRSILNNKNNSSYRFFYRGESEVGMKVGVTVNPYDRPLYRFKLSNITYIYGPTKIVGLIELYCKNFIRSYNLNKDWEETLEWCYPEYNEMLIDFINQKVEYYSKEYPLKLYTLEELRSTTIP